MGSTRERKAERRTVLLLALRRTHRKHMTRHFAPLHGLRILSLALNLPGPAALMRCRRMGATCTKLEPPSGDPMGHYNAPAYAELHEGVTVLQGDLKTAQGQELVHRELARTDPVIATSPGVGCSTR